MGNARDLRRVAACLCLAALLAFAAIPAPEAASDAVPQPLGEALRADALALALSPVALDPALDPQPPSTVLGMQWVTGDRLLVGDASYTLCELIIRK